MSSRAGRPDPAARELARQIHALPAARYEFAVFDGRMTRRLWRKRQALRSAAWLADRNRRGGHVYLRPVTTACVLLDGLGAGDLDAIRADGLAPAAVLETAPGAFEAWFRLGREQDAKVAACVGQVLGARYGTGPGAADPARLGRAAGFTNRTAALRESDGRFPRVLLADARGRVTPKADELVAAAEERLCRRAAERAARRKDKAGGGDGTPRRSRPARGCAPARAAGPETTPSAPPPGRSAPSAGGRGRRWALPPGGCAAWVATGNRSGWTNRGGWRSTGWPGRSRRPRRGATGSP